MEQTESGAASFYDELAPFYHLLYPDWEAAISRQGNALTALLRELGIEPGDAVLDAACGIGTQALGLLKHGYSVTASDTSPAAIERFKGEVEARALQATTYVDDMRTLAQAKSGSVAAVIACDNSIPHLLSDAEILAAFRNFYRCLRPGGCVVISVRDYASIERHNSDVRPYGLRYDGDRRFLAVQVWDWDGDQYDLRMYLTSESPQGICETRVLKSRYYAVPIQRLMQLLSEAGFHEVQRRDDVIFQPVLFGRRMNAA
jgi:SAM-dependent methyltransferase